MWVYEHLVSEKGCPRDLAQSCQGKSCMAWRWGFINKLDDASTFAGETFSAEEVGVPTGKFPPTTRFRGRKGFCGLGVRPTE